MGGGNHLHHLSWLRKTPMKREISSVSICSFIFKSGKVARWEGKWQTSGSHAKQRVCSFGPLINVFVLSLCFSCYICKTTQVDAEFPHHLSVKGSHSAQFEKWHTRQVALLWEAGCLSHWSSRSCHVSDFCFRKAAWRQANLPLLCKGHEIPAINICFFQVKKTTKPQNKRSQICTLPVFPLAAFKRRWVAPTSHENEEVPFMTGLHKSKMRLAKEVKMERGILGQQLPHCSWSVLWRLLAGTYYNEKVKSKNRA